MELWFALDVVLVFLAGFVAIRLLGRGRPVPAAGLGALALALAALDVYRFAALRRQRWLAMHGVITRGSVVLRKRRRMTLGQRADELTALVSRPFAPGLRVAYVFEDLEGRDREGTFLVSLREAPYYRVGNDIEVFFDHEDPDRNTSSLVLRWYYRLGGASMVDEPPPEDDLDIEVFWEEHPDSAPGAGTPPAGDPERGGDGRS